MMHELNEQAQLHPIVFGLVSILNIMGGFFLGLVEVSHIPPIIIEIFQLCSFSVGILVGIVTLVTWCKKHLKK